MLFLSVRIGIFRPYRLRKGVVVDSEKVKAMEEWPLPSNPKELRGFLGLIGYYRRFVRNYGKTAASLIKLLKKEGFE